MRIFIHTHTLTMYINDITILTSVNMWIQPTYMYHNTTKSRCHKMEIFHTDIFSSTGENLILLHLQVQVGNLTQYHSINDLHRTIKRWNHIMFSKSNTNTNIQHGKTNRSELLESFPDVKIMIHKWTNKNLERFKSLSQ